MYTVGEMYAHAEARKSPTLDGKVLRDANGKVVERDVYVIILTTFTLGNPMPCFVDSRGEGHCAQGQLFMRCT